MEDCDEVRRKYAPLVWATVYRIVKHHDHAIDCCQEIFLEAIERSKREVVNDWPAFLRWLAVRRALDRLRRERRAATHVDPHYDVALHARGPEPCEEAEFRELAQRVRLEMALLPDRQAEAFWLCCVEQATYMVDQRSEPTSGMKT
jgi:RNA polymerase sigma factor (sigma-70 family)